MTNFTCRIATPTDERAVSVLLDTSYSVLMAGDYTPEVLAIALPLMGKANPALLKSGTYYVAESARGEIVGCGGWTSQRPGTGAVEPGLGHIRHFATHPDWLRCGIGRALMNLCAKVARQHDVARFECYASLSAKKFYAALGFRARGPLDIPLAHNCQFPSVLMEHTL